MSDVLISGGGIAGSTLAILLGRGGLDIELFEREHFPREKPCGEGLMPGGMAVLHRLGLAEAVGGAPFHGVRYHFGDRLAEGRFPLVNGSPAVGMGQRRRHLDHVLYSAAAATPGVTVHSGVPVEGPVIENGRVTGLLVNGMVRRASLIVAADGVHSRIRRLLGLDLPIRRKRLGARIHYRLAPNREQPPWMDVFVRPGYELYVTPLPEREILVAALADAAAVKGSAEESIAQAFAHWRQSEAELASRLEGAEQVTPLLCISPLAGRARTGIAPGVILLGDAAGFVDPITGGGMTQTLMSAELLAKFVASGLDHVDGWLPVFEKDRQALLRDYQRLTQMVLWFEDHPHLAEGLLSALRVSPAILSHMIGVSGGMHPLFSRKRNPMRGSGPS